ncbi:polysaccharide biosynthesis/export family protein [Croceicoccus pelagius]|uniref:Sugar ABC transporter substrate-binding protein n=1 Tax=Croceicoccus pelagius TaxID=1703341 RepID=A0A916YJT4_9SPHN|nr:polysaccharide biosynthesis/export family protein [Croceicoccus pelagius]GGD48074.1 sugar ABC transporter substrate-binding protein [Croceicoccus pelagius]
MAINHDTNAKRSLARLSPALLLGLASAIGLTGCASNDYGTVSALSANSAVERGNTLAAGETVKVGVFNEPTLTGEFMIGPDGNLALPLIGVVQAAGQTSTSLATLIGTRLSEGGYVLDPKVNVETLAYRPVYVLGEVQKPGEYAYSTDMTLLQAIAKAGGYTPRAAKSYVVLQRPTWAEPKRVELKESVLQIAPGDTIMVSESFF